MIKLENTSGNSPKALTALLIQGAGASSTVSLSTEAMRANVGGEWKDDPAHLRQIVSFIGSDGQALSLEGKVLEGEAVEISGAQKVVVLVELASSLSATRQAGQQSRQFTALQVVRVVEVWESASKRLYAAPGWVESPGKTLDMSSGKIGNPSIKAA
jgi:hypothetical protein